MMGLPLHLISRFYKLGLSHGLLADFAQRVSGGIILAPEGINGSICGTPAAMDKVLNFIQEDKRLNGLRMIQSPVTPEDEAIHHGHTSQSPVGAGDDAPFRWDHVRVKLKKEVSFAYIVIWLASRIARNSSATLQLSLPFQTFCR